jgi:hypothetical protein
VDKPPLDRCEPSEQVAKLLRAVGARNTDDALKRIGQLKKGRR